MPNGTVRWFNMKTGAGFIRTNDGEDVIFLKDAIQDSNHKWVRKGAKVCFDILKSRYGHTAINVKVSELPEVHE